MASSSAKAKEDYPVHLMPNYVYFWLLKFFTERKRFLAKHKLKQLAQTSAEQLSVQVNALNYLFQKFESWAQKVQLALISEHDDDILISNTPKKLVLTDAIVTKHIKSGNAPEPDFRFHILLKGTEKIILSKESFALLVIYYHKKDGEPHKDIDTVVSKIKSRYVFGREQFGLELEDVINFTEICDYPSCRREVESRRAALEALKPKDEIQSTETVQQTVDRAAKARKAMETSMAGFTETIAVLEFEEGKQNEFKTNLVRNYDYTMPDEEFDEDVEFVVIDDNVEEET